MADELKVIWGEDIATDELSEIQCELNCVRIAFVIAQVNGIFLWTVKRLLLLLIDDEDNQISNYESIA